MIFRAAVFAMGGSFVVLCLTSCPVIARSDVLGAGDVAQVEAPAPSPAVGPPVSAEPPPRGSPVVRTRPVEETTGALDDVAGAGAWPEPNAGDLSALQVDMRTPALDPDRALVAIARETLVRAAPSFQARRIGYLRVGAVVQRSPEPVSVEGCADGWFSVAPRGYVCAGRAATLDLGHPLVRLARRRPDRAQPLPYAYGRSRLPTPPLYDTVPTVEEQRSAEADLDRHRRFSTEAAWAGISLDETPTALESGLSGPGFGVLGRSVSARGPRAAIPDSGFALLRVFAHDGRRFGLSTDFEVIPLDRLKPVVASEFRGLALDDDVTLPVVFVRSHRARLYVRADEGSPTPVREERPLHYREALAVTGKRIRLRGVQYLETRDGKLIREENLVYVAAMRKRPGWATPGRTWIDISILKQVLVAYEGTKPVYVTLVSTGADGLGDPEETHSTVRGQFLIHTKHVTATMSGDEPGDQFDLRDVPYVQYFTEGYALHAAYWHDAFGQPRSHGCINLSPPDARWLFDWTDPPVPQGWHGAMSLREGTLVSVHP